MTNTLTISRELAERISARLERLNAGFCELRALLAAPVVERQEPVAVLMLGEVFHGTNGPEVDDWDINWDRETVEKLAVDHPGEHFELFTSPPAPIAVVLPDHEFRKTVNRLRAISEMYGHTDQLRERISMELRACLDKVKEMNQ